MELSTIIGITIATSGYETLAIEAARRFRLHTGCHCIILTADGDDCYDLKFALPRLADNRVCFFFDADWHMIRNVSLNQFIGMDGLAAVLDPAATHHTRQFPMIDAEVLNFPKERYINTGCMVFNSMDARVHQAFDRASVLMAEKRAGLHPGVVDKTEQSILNRALYEFCLPTQFLSPKWNTYYYSIPAGFIESIPADMVAIHAAGVPLEKKAEYLSIQTKAWGVFH